MNQFTRTTIVFENLAQQRGLRHQSSDPERRRRQGRGLRKQRAHTLRLREARKCFLIFDGEN
jgi:hypothetical protein